MDTKLFEVELLGLYNKFQLSPLDMVNSTNYVLMNSLLQISVHTKMDESSHFLSHLSNMMQGSLDTVLDEMDNELTSIKQKLKLKGK